MNRLIYPFLVSLLLLTTTLNLSGCAGVVVGTVAAGAVAAYDRRTPGALLDDELTEIKIFNAIAVEAKSEPLWDQSHLIATSYNQIVLLAGEVPNDRLRKRAVAIIRSLPKVREIHDHLIVGERRSLQSRSIDGLITAKIKTALFFTKNIESQRVKIVTDRKIVYLMGLLTRVEADSIVGIIRTVRGLDKIVKVIEYIDP